MSEIKCEKCGRTDFKSAHGLKVHLAGCKAEPLQEATEPTARSAASIDKKIDKGMKSVKEHLDRQPKIMFYVPLANGESEGAYESVQINGYTVQVKKGVSVNLPEQIVEMLANKYRVQVEAGKDMRMTDEKRQHLT